MHPILGHWPRLALYTLAWAVAGAALAVLARGAAPLRWEAAFLFAVPLAVVVGWALLAPWWLCRAHPVAPGAMTDVATTHAFAALQAGAVAGVAALVWAFVLTRWGRAALTRGDLLRLFALLAVLGAALWVFSAAVHYVALAVEASRAAERRELESRVAAREAELRALRAQLNPHFLFNSLNSINALVGADPEGARRMCERLGDFLRRTLALGSRADVALAEELELVGRYLEIEQVRFGDRLRVDRRVAPGADACRVPPLLLQPLVENAVKHGVAGTVAGGTVALAVGRTDDALRIEVENPVDPDAPAPHGAGVGLENVRRRLEAFGRPGATLAAERGEDWFRVTITLPLAGSRGAEAER